MFGKKKLSGKKVVMIIAPQKFRDEELLHSKAVLEKNGAIVKVASLKKATAIGMLGARVMPDLPLSAVRAEEYDAVVFIGGIGAEVYFNNPMAIGLAQKAYNLGKVVGAICIAPSILAIAGLLNGKRATVWNGQKYIDILRKHGAIYTGEPVTVDGGIVTANGPQSARKFGETLTEMLASR